MLRFWFGKWGTTHHLSFRSTKFKKNCSPLLVYRISNGHNCYANFPIFSVATRQTSFFLHWFFPTCTTNKYTRSLQICSSIEHCSLTVSSLLMQTSRLYSSLPSSRHPPPEALVVSDAHAHPIPRIWWLQHISMVSLLGFGTLPILGLLLQLQLFLLVQISQSRYNLLQT